MNKLKWILFVMTSIGIMISLSPFIVRGNETPDSQLATLYTNFQDSKESKKYKVTTIFKQSLNQIEVQSMDTYQFNPNYAYHIQSDYYNGYSPNIKEHLVVRNSLGNQSYFRTYLSNVDLVNSRENIPFFRSDDQSIYDDIMTFFDTPLFHFDNFEGSSMTNISIDVSTLSSEVRTLIQNQLRNVYPSATLPQSGFIKYDIFWLGTATEMVYINYHSLFPGISDLTQMVQITANPTLNVDAMLTGSVDLTTITDWENTTLPKINVDQTIPFEYSFQDKTIQYLFLKIETAGEYLFSAIADNTTQWTRWFLFDFKLNQYRPSLSVSNQQMFNWSESTIYLEPGYYYLYLRPKNINVNSSQITYSLQSTQDDYAGCAGPSLSPVSESSIVTFHTDYSYDLDAFLITGDYDVVFVNIEFDTSVAIDFRLKQFDNWEYSFSMTHPGEDFILYFSSSIVGDHQFKISFYRYSDTPVPLADAPIIDIYAQGVCGTSIIALPFSGNEDSFGFDLIEDTELYAYAAYAKLRIYDSEGNIVPISGPLIYILSAGRYYVNIYDFTGESASFILIPEKMGESIQMVNWDEGTVRIQGFVSDYDDVDLYQMTFDSTTTIRFVNGIAKEIMIFGVDNPNLFILVTNTNGTFEIPAGTYYLTLPFPNFTGILIYDFFIEIVLPNEGGQS